MHCGTWPDRGTERCLGTPTPSTQDASGGECYRTPTGSRPPRWRPRSKPTRRPGRPCSSPPPTTARAPTCARAEACHGRGIPLLTDDAWALDYACVSHPELPEGALAQGADLAIGSVHKTLSGFSQTSVLSMRGDLIVPERLSLCFELEESTSVSTLML